MSRIPPLFSLTERYWPLTHPSVIRIMINFSDREIRRAYRQNKEAYDRSNNSPTNAHRLLLFYAVECGLKAVLMKRLNENHTKCLEEFQAGHNLNKLLDLLKAGRDLKLPENQLYMKPLQDKKERKFTGSDLNQVWRYGGCSEKNCPDEDLEKN